MDFSPSSGCDAPPLGALALDQWPHGTFMRALRADDIVRRKLHIRLHRYRMLPAAPRPRDVRACPECRAEVFELNRPGLDPTRYQPSVCQLRGPVARRSAMEIVWFATSGKCSRA
jgi:hypothetical protein